MDKISMAKAFVWGYAIEVGAQNVYEKKGLDRPSLWRDHWQEQAERWGEYAPSAKAGRRHAQWFGGRMMLPDILWLAAQHAGLTPAEGELYLGQSIFNALKKANIDPASNIEDHHETTLMEVINHL